MGVLALAVLLSAGPASAISIELRPAVEGVRCDVMAFRVGDQTTTLSTPLVVAGTAVTAVVPRAEASVELSFVAQGCWIEAVAVKPDHDSAIVHLWPEAILLGGLAVPRGLAAPRNITASFIDAAAEPASERSLECVTNERTWRCSVPAKRPMHIKLVFEGFAPVHLRDVEPAAGSTFDSGIHELIVGGSVAGRVVDARARPVGGANVELTGITAADQHVHDRASARYSVRTDAAGRFRFAAVAAGSYRLRSVVPKRSDATLNRIVVRGGEEIELSGSLVHADLADLDVLLTPPVSGTQKRWYVRLKRPGARLDEVVTVAEGPANEAGLWSREGLQAGAYDLFVLDEAGSELERRAIELRGGFEQITVPITAIAVGGRVTMGDAGVAAAIQFSSGTRRVKTSSGEDGTFRASFPKSGKWRPTLFIGKNKTQLELEPVEITQSGDQELMLKLPPGRVNGKVLDPAGKPAVAGVYLRRNGRIESQAITEADGKFELIGIEPADYSIEAEVDEAVAGPLPLTVDEDKPAEIVLRAGLLNELRGTVITAAGVAASGAVVRLFYASMGTFEDVIADPRGMFSFRIRPDVPLVDVVVLAPPYPIAMRRMDVSKPRSDRVTIQLAPNAATLRVFPRQIPPWPTITASDGVPRSLRLMLMPLLGGKDWQERYYGGYQLSVEPGPYVVCVSADECQRLQLAPHAIAIADFISSRPKESK